MKRVFALVLSLLACDEVSSSRAPDASSSSPDDVTIVRCPELPPALSEDTAPACSGDEEPCRVREDCCNSRHSCREGVCRY